MTLIIICAASLLTSCVSVLFSFRLFAQKKSLEERISKLEAGITPDYEQAKAAANAVNDFSKGITNILGFDPMNAIRAEREKTSGVRE